MTKQNATHMLMKRTVGAALPILFLVLGLSQSLNAQPFHVFPQVADGRFSDGSFYRSTLMILTNGGGAQCTLDLRGLTTSFPPGPSGSSFAINIPAGQRAVAIQTAGTQAFQRGYGTLDCGATSVFASMLFSFYVAGAKEGEATVFSSPASNSQQMIVDNREGARLGIAIANDTNVTSQYQMVYRTGSTVLATLLEIPARSSVSRFLDEVLAVVPNSVGSVSISSAQPLSAIGLRFTGGVFTTIPTF
jgi:hypothetical protein